MNTLDFRFTTKLLATLFVLLMALNSFAGHKRVHGNACHTDTDDYGYSVYNGFYVRNTTGSTLSIFCPVPSDHNLRHFNVEHLNVHGYEPNNANNTARVCMKERNNLYGSCGVTKNWGSGYSGGYGVDTSVWSDNRGEPPYLYIRLANDAQLFGFYLAD